MNDNEHDPDFWIRIDKQAAARLLAKGLVDPRLGKLWEDLVAMYDACRDYDTRMAVEIRSILAVTR